MKKLTKKQRESMAIDESNSVARLLLEHSSSGEGPQSGIEALEAYWQKSRRSPVARWIRFIVLRGEVELLLEMGRLLEAEVATKRMTRLPATPYARITAAWTRTELLRHLDRPGEAFLCAMCGLRICDRTNDVSGARNLIREIIRLRTHHYIEELASKYGNLVTEACRLSPFVDLLGTDARPPLQALEVLTEQVRDG